MMMIQGETSIEAVSVGRQLSKLSLFKPILHVEACLHSNSTARHSEVQAVVISFLNSQASPTLMINTRIQLSDVIIMDDQAATAFLQRNLLSLVIAEASGAKLHIYTPDQVILNVHVFQLSDDEGWNERTDDEENVVAANICDLPARHLDGVWENLIFDEDLQTRLLEYITTSTLFSDKMVDSNIVSWNKIVLLHGTGKTSLCRALAQKLSIRLSTRYPSLKLVEINSHSLFSKYFSESGKLVLNMFSKIHELAEDGESFIVILIGKHEVESLTAARKASSNEPGDAIRVVNALLTQIDKIKKYRNVLIMTTSNITDAIDDAFLDRADLRQYIGNPSQRATYAMLSGCVEELLRCEIIVAPSDGMTTSVSLVNWREIEFSSDEMSRRLFDIAGLCQKQGMSGRGIRKLPMIAHALFVQAPQTTLDVFCHALVSAIDYMGRNKQG
ncbi:hypothetical protein SmJEL517_g02643 [Synchytrium microbalum]|uniref:Uncharacterized protein n=1 Tax=Synchytrium microbalum TaxID=1806994 RepID=A0A507BZU7_9FUNG|nr:uncharacterized protein SmJEL517_g02643 [Synchytrium microbalum]TPX34800.1 hypothetical protein SmJEL517_g02643 [Synchytrium microbalum]